MDICIADFDFNGNYLKLRCANLCFKSLFYLHDYPGKSTGKELSPKVKEIEPSGFQQNVRLEILKLAPQRQNLGQPKF